MGRPAPGAPRAVRVRATQARAVTRGVARHQAARVVEASVAAREDALDARLSEARTEHRAKGDRDRDRAEHDGEQGGDEQALLGGGASRRGHGGSLSRVRHPMHPRRSKASSCGGACEGGVSAVHPALDGRARPPRREGPPGCAGAGGARRGEDRAPRGARRARGAWRAATHSGRARSPRPGNRAYIRRLVSRNAAIRQPSSDDPPRGSATFPRERERAPWVESRGAPFSRTRPRPGRGRVPTVGP